MSDFDPMEPLMEARDEFEARTIVAVLEDAGIEARVFVLGNLGLAHSLTPGCAGVPVHVRRSRLAQARRALEASRELGASVDWDSVDVGDEVPSDARNRLTLRSVWWAGVIVLGAGAAAVVVATAMGATSVVASQAFGAALLGSFAIMATAAFLRDWHERRAESGDDAPDR